MEETQPLQQEKIPLLERIPPIWGFGYTPYYVVAIVILLYINRKK